MTIFVSKYPETGMVTFRKGGILEIYYLVRNGIKANK